MSHSGVADLSTPRDYSHRDIVKPYFTFLEYLEVSWKYSKSGKDQRKVKDTHLQPFAYRPWSCRYCHSISRNTHCLVQLQVDWKCNFMCCSWKACQAHGKFGQNTTWRLCNKISRSEEQNGAGITLNQKVLRSERIYRKKPHQNDCTLLCLTNAIQDLTDVLHI